MRRTNKDIGVNSRALKYRPIEKASVSMSLLGRSLWKLSWVMFLTLVQTGIRNKVSQSLIFF